MEYEAAAFHQYFKTISEYLHLIGMHPGGRPETFVSAPKVVGVYMC